MNKTTLLFIKKTLNQCAQCVGFYGAVLSSADGLILASSGHFSGDEAAAAAAGLMVESSKALSMITETTTQEVLLWSDHKLFNLRRLRGDNILMICSDDLEGLEHIRLVAERAADSLDIALNMLG